MTGAEETKHAMFWRALRMALYDDMAGAPVQRPPLSDAEKADIRSRYAMGEKSDALAMEYGVSQPTISYHIRGVVRQAGRGSGVRAAA
jgi:hypothetical protein